MLGMFSWSVEKFDFSLNREIISTLLYLITVTALRRITRAFAVSFAALTSCKSSAVASGAWIECVSWDLQQAYSPHHPQLRWTSQMPEYVIGNLFLALIKIHDQISR